MEKKIYAQKDYDEEKIPFKVSVLSFNTHENLAVKCRSENEEFLMSLGRTLLAIQEANRESRRCKKKIPSSYTYDHQLTLTLDGKDSYTLEDGPAFKDAVYGIFSASSINIDHYFYWYGDFYGISHSYYYNLIPVTLGGIAEEYKDSVSLVYKEIYGDPCGENGFYCRKIEDGTILESDDNMSPGIINYKSEYGWSDLGNIVNVYNVAKKYPELIKKLNNITCNFFPQDAVEAFKKNSWDQYSPEITDEYDDVYNLIYSYRIYFKELSDFQEYLDALYAELKPYIDADSDTEKRVELDVWGDWANFDDFAIARWELTENGPRPVGVHF